MLSIAGLARAASRRVACISTAATSQSLTRPLPRLPIPKLEDTLAKYLRSLKPFYEDDAERLGRDPRTEAAKREQLASTFRDGLGKTLQDRLIALDKRSPYNWLDDNFWLRKAYLEVRDPLPINSNWWLLLKDDASRPTNLPSVPEGVVGEWQLARAAWVAWRALIFRGKLHKNEIYSESSRTGSWVRPGALRIFNSHRIPRTGCDELQHTPLSEVSSTESRHMLVMMDDWTYAVEAYSSSGEVVPLEGIIERLHAVAQDAASRRSAGEAPVPVGILTADDRDAWAQNHERLRSLSFRNDESLRFVEHAVSALCLDTYVFPDSQRAPGSRGPDLSGHLCNTKIGRNGANRWFDKGFSLIVENDGRTGVMGEHSPADALAPSLIAEWALEEPVDLSRVSFATHAAADGWRRLDWDVDDALRGEIARCQRETRAFAEDSDNSVLFFDDYGTEWIKQTVGVSPDAYVQMAIQLAWYLEQGGFTATYETALARFFLRGRTETIRSYSGESRAFVKAMVDPACHASVCLERLKEAITAHNSYTKSAIQGQGIDRHLLGLRLLMEEGERAEPFEDELFWRSQDWRLSTSGLTSGERFMGTGFGSPTHNGYGIPYLLGPDLLRFGIESKVSCPETSTTRFIGHLEESLLQMRQMCEDALGATPSAKL
ncbi:acyltransferase ChoActase/COT/CPT [Auricularia subglabra TFB-10046 SS5]|nr:acyltransferase ChoActase/COT/CPT [Auricularia subglabra TFB-10046 SS5]